MKTGIPSIPLREVLHFLGWRGSPVEEQVLQQIQSAMAVAQKELEAHTIVRHFALESDMHLANTVFTPGGSDICRLLSDSDGAILMAATLGAQSERLLLRYQARSSSDALIMDAVLSAAIEAVCDEQESLLRKEYLESGYYLTDRFSPGYGDMPLEQSKEICAVLQSEKNIGLTVSRSGIMIPRKSVTAIIGVSKTPQKRRPSPCTVCHMRDSCTLRKI